MILGLWVGGLSARKPARQRVESTASSQSQGWDELILVLKELDKAYRERLSRQAAHDQDSGI